MSKKHVLYITPEIALLTPHSFPTYTGGLGYLAGTYALDAPRAGLNAVVVAPLSRYYRQTIVETPEGRRMGVEDQPLRVSELLELTPAEFSLLVDGADVFVRVWRFVGAPHDCADVLFLDTDYEKNSEHHRLITRYLYGGFSGEKGGHGGTDWRRIAFAYVLGVGAVHAARALGYPVSLYHLNECHAVFAAMELLREARAKHDSLDEAIETVRRHMLFTTHTPVPAGIWQAPLDIVVGMTDRHFQFGREGFERLGQKDNDFNLAVAALRLAGIVNAVSKRHEVVSKRMFSWVKDPSGMEYPITSVTNGVAYPYWQHSDYRHVTTPTDLQQAKRGCKRELIDLIRTQTGKRFGDNILTGVFTRRWTGYKRPLLPLDQFETVGIERLLRHNQLQLIFAGMPNPDEGEMVGAWNRVLRLSETTPNLVILPGYDVALSGLLKAGADLWIFTSAANKEACATSPAGAMLNGTIVIGTPDGMLQEVDPQNSFLFGHASEREWYRQYRDDAAAFRHTLASAIALYYDEPAMFYEKAFAAKLEAEEKFPGSRMIHDYMTLYHELLAKH